MASREPRSQSVSTETARRVEAHAHQAVGEALDVPVVRHLGGQVLVDQDVDLLVQEVAHGVRQVLVVEDLVPLGVDRLALLVDDVVVLDDALAHVEVEALDAGLRALDGLGDHARLDGHVVLEPEPGHEARDPLAGEALEERILEREVEARRARVALAAGAAAQLVVDAPAVVALGADDVEAAGGHDALVVLGAGGLRLCERRGVDLRRCLERVDALAVEGLGGHAGGVAAEQDVRAAAGHVGGDGDRPAAPGLGDDGGFLLVELGVEDVVRDAVALEHLAQDLALLDARRADQDRPADLAHLDGSRR